MCAHCVERWGETDEHLLLECVGLEKERGLIKQYLKEEEKGLGDIYKGKNVKVLEIEGLMLYKRNKAQLQIQRRK